MINSKFYTHIIVRCKFIKMDSDYITALCIVVPGSISLIAIVFFTYFYFTYESLQIEEFTMIFFICVGDFI